MNDLYWLESRTEVDDQLIPNQAGFCSGPSGCGQVVNLTQYIEDGYKSKMITGVIFVDFSAVCDTVIHRSTKFLK